MRDKCACSKALALIEYNLHKGCSLFFSLRLGKSFMRAGTCWLKIKLILKNNNNKNK